MGELKLRKMEIVLGGGCQELVRERTRSIIVVIIIIAVLMIVGRKFG